MDLSADNCKWPRTFSNEYSKLFCYFSERETYGCWKQEAKAAKNKLELPADLKRHERDGSALRLYLKKQIRCWKKFTVRSKKGEDYKPNFNGSYPALNFHFGHENGRLRGLTDKSWNCLCRFFVQKCGLEAAWQDSLNLSFQLLTALFAITIAYYETAKAG